jgi:hypothetical protein
MEDLVNWNFLNSNVKLVGVEGEGRYRKEAFHYYGCLQDPQGPSNSVQSSSSASKMLRGVTPTAELDTGNSDETYTSISGTREGV